MTDEVEAKVRLVPIEVIADEAAKRGVTGEPRWFLLGYHVGREVALDTALLANEERLRKLVRTFTG